MLLLQLHLIDTPGHVDFSYEVSRSLAACEGAILIVDAAQGIEAQTLANLYLALGNDLTIIPVINKIDLPNADIPKRMEELTTVLGFREDEVLKCSAKTGEGVKEIIDELTEQMLSYAQKMEFEKAAEIRDKIKEWEKMI